MQDSISRLVQVLTIGKNFQIKILLKTRNNKDRTKTVIYFNRSERNIVPECLYVIVKKYEAVKISEGAS
jgi:hypothetical protein